MNQELDIRGHSGCNIRIMQRNGQLVICKSSGNVDYNDRLLLQIKKQNEASDLPNLNFRVPQIYSTSVNDGKLEVMMEYVYSKYFIEYFENAGFKQIDFFISALTTYIDREIEEAEIQTVSADVVKQKYADVCRRIRANGKLSDDRDIAVLLDKAENVFNRFDDMVMPVGRCHGDLTFSNILFSGDNYYVIDFLDSYIESPLMDIIKVRQDSAYLWSQLMYTRPYDKIRLQIVCSKIDKAISSHYSQYEWYRSYYTSLQLMNMLRIMQYAEDEKVTDYLKNIIKQITDEL